MATKIKDLGVFQTSCWILALIAFVELSAVGLALGIQRQQIQGFSNSSSEPDSSQIVTRFVTIPGAERE
ncbi:MAG: hypothetical protein AAGC74_12660, partial [Verrucomicrobiota bacterium]